MMSSVCSSFINGEEQRIASPQNNDPSGDEFSKSKEIVKKILEQERCEYQKRRSELKSKEDFFYLAGLFNKQDSDWQDEEELYLEIEKWISGNSDKAPSWQVAGPLNYAMSLEQMKYAITNKFKEMTFSGNLITEKLLAEKHNRETLYPAARRGGNNLTRIWGAEFLKSNFVDSTTLNAADHFLIVDDDASEIEVQVWHGEYPYLSIVNNAHILSQKIEGTKSAREYRFSGKLNELQYGDFTDPGNIICDSKGMGWVVDTELKSFDSPKLDRDLYLVSDYLKKRFKVLAGEEYYCLYQTFKISIADLKSGSGLTS